VGGIDVRKKNNEETHGYQNYHLRHAGFGFALRGMGTKQAAEALVCPLQIEGI
jgi:hypothetical protein